jgi:hypothetical protein
MARIAVDQLATGTYSLLSSTYSSDRWNLGSLIKQFTGSQSTDNFIGPIKIAQARPFEESTAFQLLMIDAISWSSRYDWIFGIENLATAVAARRIMAYLYDRNTGTYTCKGFITMTLNTSTAHTTRGLRVAYYTHTTGTVAVSGTAVTGTSTLFTTQRIGAGARIGFGTTDPTAVTQWYYISSITNDTTITLTTTAGTIGSTSYVIEELRPIVVTTNATVANGGVFMAKGINWDTFTPAGTTISASGAGTDNLQLVYWLADAAIVTNTTAAGAGIDGNVNLEFNNTFTHSLYVPDVTTTRVYSYNLRAANTITTGKMTLSAGTNSVITGAQAFTGTLAQVQNCMVETANHGPGSGVKSLYFVTTTRLYRASTSNITTGNTLWQSDVRTEVPPGSTNTMPATSVLSSIDYDSVTDRFLALTTNATAFRSYYTQFPATSGNQFDYAFLNDFKLFDGSTSDNTSVPIPYNTNSTACLSCTVNGVTHLLRSGTGAIGQHALFAIPTGAHWDFASTTNQIAISPIITTSNNNKFVRVVPYSINTLGSGAFPIPLNDYRVYYRTSGMSDNSGAWTLLSSTGDLSSVTGVSQIQFKFEFQMLGQCFGIPARILGFSVIYDDLSTESHYQPSVNYSSAALKQFAWRFSTAFGTTVSPLRVRLYDATTGGLLVDDNTTSPTGTFEESTDDGANWSSWTNTDKTNNTTYLRYTPSSLADSIKVRALLTLN